MNGRFERKVTTITYGEPITANMHGVEFNLTEDKEYIVLKYDGDCIQIKNDLEKIEWYSLDYFKEF